MESSSLIVSCTIEYTNGKLTCRHLKLPPVWLDPDFKILDFKVNSGLQSKWLLQDECLSLIVACSERHCSFQLQVRSHLRVKALCMSMFLYRYRRKAVGYSYQLDCVVDAYIGVHTSNGKRFVKCI